MTRFVVATTDEIPVGGNKVVTLKGRPVVIFNIKGEYFALLNRCPHEGASLCQGAIVGLVKADEAGQYRFTRHGELLRCPWHGWEFDIRTGQSYFDPSQTFVKSFPVAVEDGGTLAKGPYVAETFQVCVEHNYVLIEI